MRISQNVFLTRNLVNISVAKTNDVLFLPSRISKKGSIMLCHRKTAIAHINCRRRVQLELCDSLNDMRSEARYCDLDLVAHGKVMPVHKNILAGSSAYFDTMLSSNFIEHESKSVDLSDVFPKPETLEEILEYIYTGKITLSEENFRDVLNGASHFFLNDLRESCGHFMFVNLSPVNVLELWALADMYSLTNLTRICQKVVRARFHDMIMHKDDFLHIPLRWLSEIIHQGGMDFLSIQDRIRCLINWLSQDLDEREGPLRSLLEDPVMLDKLGIDEVPNHDGGEAGEHLRIKDHLTSLLDDPRYAIPALGAHNEALVAWNYKPSSEEDTRVLTICAYVPETNLWYTVTKLRVTRFFGQVIGFIGREAVFKSLHGFVKVSLDDHTFVRIALPSLQRTSGIRSHSIFVFEDKVFCIMDISKNVRRNLSNGTVFLYPEAQSYLKVYNFETQQWTKVCDLPVPKQIAWLPLQFHVIPRPDHSCCYILAMSTVNNFQIRGPADQWRISGPYLLAVKKRRTKYTIVRLTDPPIDRDNVTLSDLYYNLRFIGKDNKLFMYGVTVNANQGTELCEGILQFNLDTEEWTEGDARSIRFPQHNNLHVEGLETINFHIGNVTRSGVQSFGRGNIYRLNVPCPYISQFCSADMETGEVRELAPPPSEKLREFSTCSIPLEVLEGASCQYSQRFDKKCKNRMTRGHLAGHDRQWGCTFQSRPNVRLSESMSTAHSSDVSEQEIDIEN